MLYQWIENFRDCSHLNFLVDGEVQTQHVWFIRPKFEQKKTIKVVVISNDYRSPEIELNKDEFEDLLNNLKEIGANVSDRD